MPSRTRDHLTQDPPTQDGDLLHFKLRHAGVPALEIEIVTRETTTSNAGAKNPSGKRANAQLAIIIDDLGSDRAASRNRSLRWVIPSPFPVLPNHEHSVDIAKEAHRRGFQVMLHLPMQSIANETPEAQELHPGMPAA